MSLHSGNVSHHPERVSRTLRELRTVFASVYAYTGFMPLYGAKSGMACASMHSDPRALTETTIGERLCHRHITDLRLYTPRVHASLFASPAYAERRGA